ncbi:MAG TPA: HAD hydrolase-like protein, partial [Spirochaetota bacterium]|nr:HAD hydrolase-like protein [Spirochaetota bacterium]
MKTNKVEAVIFDFDGTLVDSEENYFEADRILLKKHGLDIDTEFKKQYIGIGAFEMMEDIRTKHSIAAPTDDLVNE